MQILGLYQLLAAETENPIVALNRAVALARVRGAPAGLAALSELAEDPRLRDGHRPPPVPAHLAERAGDPVEALAQLRTAARRSTNTARAALPAGPGARPQGG